eukprot:COSAG06_NODE_5283_length_3587_cov_33.101491_3_plen_49_part_00
MDRRLFWANVSAFLHYETISCKGLHYWYHSNGFYSTASPPVASESEIR